MNLWPHTASEGASVTEDRVDVPAFVDLAALAAAGGRGPLWTHQSADLNVNLVALDVLASIGESVNREVDVLLVGIAGEGTVDVNGRPLALRAGQALIVPRGSRRAIHTTQGGFVYLTCHRRRAGLWPSGVPRPGDEPADTASAG
jgi:mannose-6-phosphate isomerase-like protein (cupin superfamily)